MAGIVIAASLLFFVMLLALTIDIGQIYYSQRNLEKLAVVAALDASRAQSGCYPDGSGAPGSLANATESVTATLLRNNITPAEAITPTIEFGRYDNTSVPGKRLFLPLPSADSGGVDAVRVTLRRPTPALLLPVKGFSDFVAGGTLVASSSAQHAPTAGYTVGSGLLNIDTSRSAILNGLLTGLLGAGSGINLSAVSYQGLADANVSLGALAGALGLDLANPGTLLNTQLPLPTILGGLATALNNTGGATQIAAAATLNSLAALVDPSRKTTLGEVLGIEDGAEQLVGALPINTLGILNALALSASQGLYPIKLPSLGLNLGLVKVDTYLSVLDPPQGTGGIAQTTTLGRPGDKADGTPRTSAYTAQIVLAVRASLAVPLLATVRLGVDTTVASAMSNLTSIRCPNIGTSPNPKPVVQVAVTPSVARIKIGSYSLANPTAPVTSGSLISVPLINLLTVNATSVVDSGDLGGGRESILTFTDPFGTSQTVTSGVNIGGAVADAVTNLPIQVCVPIFGCILSTGTPGLGVLRTAVNLLRPAIVTLGSVLDTVVQGLFDALGIQVGTATITFAGSPYPVNYGNDGREDHTKSFGPPTTSVPLLFNQDKPAAVPVPPPSTR